MDDYEISESSFLSEIRKIIFQDVNLEENIEDFHSYELIDNSDNFSVIPYETDTYENLLNFSDFEMDFLEFHQNQPFLDSEF